MSRVRTTESDEDILVKKPRARKPRSVAAVDEEIPVKPRKRAAPRAKKLEEKTEEVSRKAPTRISAVRKRSIRNTRVFVSVLVFCCAVTGVGVGVGMMDKGSIDVVAVVNERNEKINKGEVRDENGQPTTITVPVQNQDTRPNGGLQIADAPIVTETPIATSSIPDANASSSDGVASSSEAVPAADATVVEGEQAV
jgi:hypothetical protein